MSQENAEEILESTIRRLIPKQLDMKTKDAVEMKVKLILSVYNLEMDTYLAEERQHQLNLKNQKYQEDLEVRIYQN